MTEQRPAHRFWERVDSSAGPDACWPCTGHRDRNGYVQWEALGEWYAHRVAYRVLVGPIPAHLTLDHLCRNRGCVNPRHLEPVTLRENIARSPLTQATINSRKTHCYRGHELTPANVIRKGPDRRQRTCRRCQNDARLRRLAERAAA